MTYRSLHNYSGKPFLCPDETTVARYDPTESDSPQAQGASGRKGVSQETVYEDTGLHIGRIETERHNITVSTLSRLCDYYGITLSEFFEGIKVPE